MDLPDLAQQVQRGVNVIYRDEVVGRTLSATPEDQALRVVIELDNPTELPPIDNLQFRAIPKDLQAKLGTSLTVQAVEIKTKG